MRTPLTEKEMKEWRRKFSEQGIYKVNDARDPTGSKKRSVGEENDESGLPDDFEDPVLSSLSMKKEEKDILLKQMISVSKGENPQDIKVDWKNITTI